MLECAELIEQLGTVGGAGRRGLLANPVVKQFADSGRIKALVRPHLLMEPQPVRAIYFDKSPEANWLVPWHQDLTVAVRQRRDVPGWGPWSVKEGVHHVQPPTELLEQMVAVRVHLDDSDADNGALRVLPVTHLSGRLNAPAVSQLRTQAHEVLCEARAGDVLLMRPLLLHSSSRSHSARHRRVLHVEYAGFDLPPTLEWSQEA